MNFATAYDIALYNYYTLLAQSYYTQGFYYSPTPVSQPYPQNLYPLACYTAEPESPPQIKKTYVEELRQLSPTYLAVKREQGVETITNAGSEESETVKLVQNKTKDLMRPFARIVYRFFKKLLENGTALEEHVIEEIKQFNQEVDELRSKNPCKFTQVIMSFLRNVSATLRIQLESYVRSTEFRNEIIRTDTFKHWKNKTELVGFLQQFITENKHLLKPTKFYKFQYKRTS